MEEPLSNTGSDDGAEVLVDIVPGGVAIVTINRPRAANAMSRATRALLAERLARVDQDEMIGAIVLTGAGGRAFSAGLDLRELGADDDALREVATDDPTINPAAAVLACRKPVIGAIDGVCVTGALELALACDLLIASDAARFADTHAAVGILPVWGLSQRLSRLIGPNRAREMSLTAGWIDAATALSWGLVNQVVPAAELLAAAVAKGRAIAQHDGRAIVAQKALINDGFAMDLGAALRHERTTGGRFNKAVTSAMLEERRRALTGGGKSA